jgi:hypothetical protein
MTGGVVVVGGASVLASRRLRTTERKLYSDADSPSVKYSAVFWRKSGFNEQANPSLRMPSNFSVSELKPMKPQIFANGLSRSANVGRKISCSTLSRRSSGATRNRFISRFGCSARRSPAHSQKAGVDSRGAFHLKAATMELPLSQSTSINSMVRFVTSLNCVGNSSTILDISPKA